METAPQPSPTGTSRLRSPDLHQCRPPPNRPQRVPAVPVWGRQTPSSRPAPRMHRTVHGCVLSPHELMSLGCRRGVVRVCRATMDPEGNLGRLTGRALAAYVRWLQTVGP